MANTNDVLVFNHDMKNNISAAVSLLEMFISENPSFSKNEDLLGALAGLEVSLKLSGDISIAVGESYSETINNTKLESVLCDQHFFENAKPAYNKLRMLYPIEINDTYVLLDEEKYVPANQAAICSLRENIVNNAVQAGATKIDVCLEMKIHCLVITYQDNGCGMTQKEIDNIYLEEYGDNITHGLGTRSILNTVKECNNAYIQYSSTKNIGTNVRIIVPYL